MKIAEAAQACGLSQHTIRYYEKAGMLPEIARFADGHRRFSKENVDWLILLASLRETGLPNGLMRHFAQLYKQGDATVPERRQILLEHQKRLEVHQEKLTNCRKLLDFKLSRYAEILGKPL